MIGRWLIPLLWCAQVFGQGITVLPKTAVFPKTTIFSGVGDNCTGALLFSWHFETTNVTTGSPVGCSVGATTPTTNGSPTISGVQFEDGTHSGHFSASGDYYSFVVSSEDIIQHAAGTLDFWTYVTTFADGSNVLSAPSSTAGNGIFVSMRTVSTVNQFRLIYQAASNNDNTDTVIGGGFSLNTWYHVVARWDVATAHSGNHAQICADTSTGTTNCAGYGIPLDIFAGSISATRWGNDSGSAPAFYLDIGKVYSTWQ